VPTAEKFSVLELSTLKMDYHTVKLIGTTCSLRNASAAASLSRQETGGSKPLTITTTASASSARNATRTSKGRVSSPKEENPSVKRTRHGVFRFPEGAKDHLVHRAMKKKCEASI